MPEKNKEEESKYFGYFKKLYESWEKSASQAVDIWLKSPLFTNSMERAVEKSIEVKNYIQDTIERTLKQRYIPTRNDTDKLKDSLDKLQEKLKHLEEKIKNLEANPKPTAERKKTKSKTTRRKRKSE